MIERPEWADDPIGRRWWDFHCEHPEVYGLLLRFCEQWRAAHTTRKCGMKMLWERLRWEHAIGNVGGDYKLNNNYPALYARYIMEADPRYAGLFETRARQCDGPADKPDPAWPPPFTGYAGCPDVPCLWRSICRASGDCYLLDQWREEHDAGLHGEDCLSCGGPTEDEMNEHAAEVALEDGIRQRWTSAEEAGFDRVQPWD